MGKLKNKIIVVTGGNGLLGRDIINTLEREQAICINIDINLDTDIEKGQIQCDIRDQKSINDTLELILQKFKKIDGLVNNAYPRTEDWGRLFEEIDFSSWKKNVDWHLNSYFYLCQKVSSSMIQQNYGSIVNISSVYGKLGPDFNLYEGTPMTMPAAYSAIKGGITNFTRYLASYLGPNNIRVNSISPGGIFDNQNKDFVKKYLKKTPLRRMANPEDVSPAVCFLLSEESKYITGHDLVVDGGFSVI